MGQIHARIEDGRTFLVEIACDRCDHRAKPADATAAGWVKEGWDMGPGTEKCERYYCPECSCEREEENRRR